MAVDRAKITQQAEKLVSQGKVDLAIAQYEQLVRDNPRDMTTINKIGDLYSRLGKKREAILQFNKIGEFYAKDGFFLKAIAIYKKIGKLEPNYLEAYVRLADLYAQQGLVLEARSQYQLVAQRYLKAGDVKRTIELHRTMVEMDPADMKLRTVLADLLGSSGRTADAAEEYVVIAAELERKGKVKESKAMYQKAAVLHPGSPSMSIRMAETQMNDGDLAGALKTAREALKKGENADLHAIIGEIHGKESHLKDAVASFERSTTLAPTRVDLTLRLARARLAAGDQEAALRTIDGRADAVIKDGQMAPAAEILEEILKNGAGPAGLRLMVKMKEAAKDTAAQLRWGDKLVASLLEAGEHGEADRLAGVLLALDPKDSAVKARLEKARSRPEAPGAGRAAEGTERKEAAAEAAPMEGEDEDFISEHMTEADVFVKYGLGDRAVEQLQAIIDRFPAHAPAYQKLKEIYLEAGDREATCRTMVLLVKAHMMSGNAAAAEEALAELKRFDPASRETGALARGIATGSYQGPAVEGAELSVEEDDALEVEIEAEAEAEPESGQKEGEGTERIPGKKDLETVDALLQQKKRDEAVALLRKLAEACGSHPEIVSRMRQAVAMQPTSAPGKSATASQGGSAARTVPDVEEQEEEFIIEAEEEAEDTAPRKVPASAAAPARAPAPASPRAAGSANDLLDLASEIDAALGGAAQESAALVTGEQATPEGHSLEEIVQAFKKGVEEKVDADDFETRYSLAIAYKEMGLIDEAIGEFQFASKDPKLLVDCCSMLGVCFREKQMTSLAVKWYRKGLDAASGRDEETALGLRYDLASLLAEMGERQEAVFLLTEVYGINSRFRDVAARLRELQSASSR